MEPVKFGPDDPDAETNVPGVMVLHGEMAALCTDLKATIGIRTGGGEEMFLSMGTGKGVRLFCPFTPVTARALAGQLTSWAGAQEAKAAAAASAALARAGA